MRLEVYCTHGPSNFNKILQSLNSEIVVDSSSVNSSLLYPYGRYGSEQLSSCQLDSCQLDEMDQTEQIHVQIRASPLKRLL